MWAMWAEK